MCGPCLVASKKGDKQRARIRYIQYLKVGRIECRNVERRVACLGTLPEHELRDYGVATVA